MRGTGFAVWEFPDRVELTVTGEWSDQASRLVQTGQVDRIVVNQALGFVGGNIDFLAGLPVRQLVVVLRGLTDVTALYQLADTLELLHLTVAPHTMIDLAPLPHLKDLAADWQQVADTISTATRLTSPNASRFSEPNLEPLSTLTGLENLALADRPRVRSLEGLAAFQELRRLVVAPARSLHDVSALAFAPHLERLELEGDQGLATLDALGD